MVLFSLITALILNREIRARGFFRAVFFFPVLLSPVVVALIWKWILLRDGILNAFLVSIGLDKILFFVSPGWSMFWAVFVSIWVHMGFYTLILLAGLQAIPPDLYEAAEMDGTSKERVFWRITLPLLWPNMLVVIVLALIKGVQIFDEVFVLDVRSPGEFEGDLGHLQGAHLIPLDQLRGRLGEVPHDRPVVTVCQSGKRSAMAAEILRKSGYAQVANVAGGLIQWSRLALPFHDL